MSYREQVALGRTGLEVSRLGIGSGYGVPAAAVEKAFHEHGVNYLYWSLRKRAGMADAIRNLAPQHRDELVVALQTYDHLGWFMEGGVEKSLKKLGLDYADVLILGWFNRRPRRGILDRALELKERGLVRWLALSGHHRPLFGELARDPDNPIDVFMTRYNAAHRGAEQDIFPHLPASGRPGLTAYTATRWGQLLQAKRMPDGEAPMTPSECYRFALASEHVDLVLTGPDNAEQMDQALEALDAPPLSDEELQRIRRIGDHVAKRKPSG